MAKPPGQGFAIASLVLGLLGGVVLSVIFGIVALVRVRRGAAGKGFAIAGLVLSGLWVAAIGIVTTFVVVTSPQRDSTGAITRGGSVSTTDLRVGDCLKSWHDSPSIDRLPVTRCSQPHEAEVYYSFAMTDAAYPGDDGAREAGRARCMSAAETEIRPDKADTQEVAWLRPTADSWAQGARDVECIAVSTTGPITGSVRGT